MFRRRHNSEMPVTSTPKRQEASSGHVDGPSVEPTNNDKVTAMESFGLRPTPSRLQAETKQLETSTKPKKIDLAHTRSQSICVESNLRYDKRARKPPVRFNPEDFVKKSKQPHEKKVIAVQKTRRATITAPPKPRRTSVAVVAESKSRRASVAAAPEPQKVKTNTRRSSTSSANGSTDDIITRIVAIARCSEKRLPKNSPVETPLYVKAKFPGNINASRNGDLATMMKFDKQSGILHVNPKAKMSKRKVTDECDFVSLTLKVSTD